MSEKFNNIIAESAKCREQTHALVEKLLAVAQPGSVYSQPVQSGSYTVITASELVAGFGFGYGVGGGGGGGMSNGRPAAVVTIGPEGVQVKPLVDVSKLGIAALTTIGAMFLVLGRMR